MFSTWKTNGQYMKSTLMNQETMAVWKGRATLAAIPALLNAKVSHRAPQTVQFQNNKQ